MAFRLKHQRDSDLKYQQVISKQLSPTLLDELDQGGDGVDQLEFVFGMLGLMGAELCDAPLNFKLHALPLIHRFQQLDADTSGTLDSQDLAFMLDQAQQVHAARKSSGTCSTKESLQPKLKGVRASSKLFRVKRSILLNLSESTFRVKATASVQSTADKVIQHNQNMCVVGL